MKPARGQLLGNRGAGQVVPPKGAHGGMRERFAHIAPHGYGETQALQVAGAHHRNRLQNAADGKRGAYTSEFTMVSTSLARAGSDEMSSLSL